MKQYDYVWLKGLANKRKQSVALVPLVKDQSKKMNLVRLYLLRHLTYNAKLLRGNLKTFTNFVVWSHPQKFTPRNVGVPIPTNDRL